MINQDHKLFVFRRKHPQRVFLTFPTIDLPLPENFGVVKTVFHRDNNKAVLFLLSSFLSYILSQQTDPTPAGVLDSQVGANQIRALPKESS